jgi:hypothetical protein
VVKNSRREVTLYFLSDDVVELEAPALEVDFELSEEELLPLPESFEEEAEEDSFFSDFSDEPFSDEPFSDEPFSDAPFSEDPPLALSPSFFGPPLPGLVLPLLA